MLQIAHEAACNAYNILSDIVVLCRDYGSVYDETEASIEELHELADELQSSLFDLIEKNSKKFIETKSPRRCDNTQG